MFGATDEVLAGKALGPVDRAFDDRLVFSCPWESRRVSLSGVTHPLDNSAITCGMGKISKVPSTTRHIS